MDDTLTSLHEVFPERAMIALMPTEQNLKEWDFNYKAVTPYQTSATYGPKIASGKLVFELPQNFISMSESHLEFTLQVPEIATANTQSYLENAYALFKEIKVYTQGNQSKIMELKEADIFHNLQFSFTTEDWLESQGKYSGIGIPPVQQEVAAAGGYRSYKLLCKFDSLFRYRGLLPLSYFIPRMFVEFTFSEYGTAFFAGVRSVASATDEDPWLGTVGNELSQAAAVPSDDEQRYTIVNPRLICKLYYPDPSYERKMKSSMDAGMVDIRRGAPLVFRSYEYDSFTWPSNQTYYKWVQVLSNVTTKAVFVVFTKERSGAANSLDPFTNSGYLWPCKEETDTLEVQLTVGDKSYPSDRLKISKAESTQAYMMLMDTIGRENDFVLGNQISPDNYVRKYAGRNADIRRVNKRAMGLPVLPAATPPVRATVVSALDAVATALNAQNRNPNDVDKFILAWNLETDKDLLSGKVSPRLQIEFNRSSIIGDPDNGGAAMALTAHIFTVTDSINTVSTTSVRPVDLVF